ncbi:hypothetical protein ACH42_00565 [Endozoicomonas sp. (ex Bugula neritina AB1)]|nr:hypothetical protein ACH42_00565 [Endozoicomonas sp. (ex Bugula neritina AB1)]
MSKKETWRLREYWQQTGGLLIEEFMMVRKKHDGSVGRRLLDGLIILGEETAAAETKDISIEGKDIIVVQVKGGRLGMYLMGQAYFSGLLLKKLKPRSIKVVAICARSDIEMEKLCQEHDIEVVVIPVHIPVHREHLIRFIVNTYSGKP